MDSGKAVEAGDKDKAAELLASTSRKLDKAVSKGVIHKNQAANRKSGLAAPSTTSDHSAASSATFLTAASSA